MKVELKSSKPVFQPIKIELTIETKDELLEVWHRFNFNIFKLRSLPNYSVNKPMPKNESTIQVWKLIDELLKGEKV